MQSFVSLGLGSGNGTPLIALFFGTEAPPADTTPDPFSGETKTGQALSATVTFAAVTPVGYDTATTISITGGTYSINGGAYTGTSGTLSPGDSVTVRHTSSASYLTATNTVLTVGGVSDTFTSTTLIDPAYTASGDGSINMGFGFGF